MARQYGDEERRAAVDTFNALVAVGRSKADAGVVTCEQHGISPASLARFRREIEGASPEARPAYPPQQRAEALTLYATLRKEMSNAEAEQRVLAELGISAPTLRRFRNQGAVKATGPHGNRKLSDDHVDKIVEWATSAPTVSTYELTKRVASELLVEVDEATVQRALHARGIKKRHLQRQHRAEREARGEKPVRVGYTERHRRKPPKHEHRGGYPSDLTDGEWSILEPLLEEHGASAPTKYALRDIIDAIRYQTRTGCAWRYLPNDLPNWPSVMRFQQQWTRSGLLDLINEELVKRVRLAERRSADPTVAILDAQTVKADGVSADVGFDGNKKLKGRKRTLLTDTMGLILAVGITAANVHDAQAAVSVVNPAFSDRYPTIETISADLAYQGSFQRAVDADPNQRYTMDIVRRPSGGNGGVWSGPQDHSVVVPATKDRPFPILRRRWVIERTNGWNMRYRRLRVDYERLPETSRARVIIASIAQCLGRL